MHEKLRKVVAFVLVQSVLAVGGAQETPAAQQVVERFAEALSAGDTATVFGLLAGSATWTEHDLYWRTFSGRDLQIRAYELIRAGVRLETEVIAVVGDDQMVIAHERMWGDFVPEGMAPLRSTTVYVVESGWLMGVTRVLSAEQRDALTLAAVVGSTWEDRLSPGTLHRFEFDGSYRNFETMDDLRSGRHVFSGTYQFERGVLTLVADPGLGVCRPDERFVMRGRMLDQDTWLGVLVRDETDCAFYLDLLTEPYTTFRLADD